MKKKLFYFLGSTLAVLITAYTLRYKTGNDISHSIPGNAVAVVNINLRNLENHLLFDFLTHPTEYIRSSSKKSKDSSAVPYKIYKEIDLPKNLIFYSLENDLSTWQSIPLGIKNSRKLSHYLLAKGFAKDSIENKNIWHKNNLYIIVENNKIYLVFSSKKTNVNLLAQNNKTSFIDAENSMYKPLSESKSDIVLVHQNKSTVEINFAEGAIDFTGVVITDLLKKTEDLSDKSLISLSANINKESDFYKKLIRQINPDKFSNLTQLNLDSVQQKWQGKIRFKLHSFITQKDTIKTYEYDDDFNKIEKISVQDNLVPDFTLQLSSNATLSKYLLAQNALQIVDNDSIFVPFPLAKTKFSSLANNTILYTISKKLSYDNNAVKLNFHIDLNNYQKQSKASIFAFEKTHIIKTVSIQIDNDNRLKGSIQLNELRNAFSLLYL
jgi:hypothetical protein